MQVERYRERISGPLLDRIDLHVEAPAVPFDELRKQEPGEVSAAIRERVMAAREVQRSRLGTNAADGDGEYEPECAGARSHSEGGADDCGPGGRARHRGGTHRGGDSISDARSEIVGVTGAPGLSIRSSRTRWRN